MVNEKQQASVRDDWQGIPEHWCEDCGQKGVPVLYIDFDGQAHPHLDCECGELAGEAILIEWPFEGKASGADFRALGFEIV